jgi:hypothetical protein
MTTTKSNSETIMRARHSKWYAFGATLALGIAAAGCGAQGDGELPGDEASNTGIESVQAKLTMGYTTSGCSIAEVGKINSAMGILLNAVGPNLPTTTACIQAAPLVEFSCAAGQSREHIIDSLLATSITRVTCAMLSPGTIGEAPVSVSAGQLSIDHNFLLNATDRQNASNIAHELTHNWGYRHDVNPFGTQFHPNTVPEQLEACILTNGTPNPSAGPLTDAFRDRCDRNPHVTQRAGMHACPIGQYMTGIHASSNSFLCMTFPGHSYQAFQEISDTKTQVNGMHGCPTNFAMTGLYNSGAGTLLCAPFAGVPTVTTDNGTQRIGMHACPVNQVDVGFQGSRNQLACAH